MYALIALSLMVGQVGSFMGPPKAASAGGGGGGFSLLTEASDPLATESSNLIVLESAP